MIKRFLLLAICSVLFANVYSKGAEEVLLTIDNEKVTTEEFIRVYSKNNQNPKFDRKSLEEYLELFINFKLKVAEAESLKMDTAASFVKEYGNYVKQLEAPYFKDESKIDLMVKQTYERLKYEVKASHILIKCEKNSSPKDTLKAYNKIKDIRDKAIKGEDFGGLAAKYSEDPSAKTNKGNLGYFGVFRMVYDFELAAYNTPVGSVSDIVRTQFGYHIIYVHEKNPSKGQIQVAHIMHMTPRGASVNETEEAKKKSYAIYDSLMMGKSFQEMARLYSEDKGTAMKGGELSFFGIGRMVKEFEEAAFKLDSIGQIAEPIQTSYGWHIIKLIDTKQLGTFEEEKEMIEPKVRRLVPSGESEKLVLNRLRSEYSVKWDESNMLEIVPLLDTSIYFLHWRCKVSEGYDKVVLYVEDSVYTQMDFMKFIEGNQKSVLANSSYETVLRGKMVGFENAMLKEYERSQLPIKYPEFKHLVQEYHDGILLFNLTDEMVWTKAVKDTAGLEKFYEENKTSHMWGDRVKTSIYTYSDSKYDAKVLAIAKKAAKKGIDPKDQIEKFQTKINKKDTAFTISSETAKFSKGDEPVIDAIEWVAGKSNKSTGKNGEVKLVYIHNPISPEPKLLSEAKGLFTADYQAQLEKEWIEALREKYEFKVNELVFDSLVK